MRRDAIGSDPVDEVSISFFSLFFYRPVSFSLFFFALTPPPPPLAFRYLFMQNSVAIGGWPRHPEPRKNGHTRRRANRGRRSLKEEIPRKKERIKKQTNKKNTVDRVETHLWFVLFFLIFRSKNRVPLTSTRP